MNNAKLKLLALSNSQKAKRLIDKFPDLKEQPLGVSIQFDNPETSEPISRTAVGIKDLKIKNGKLEFILVDNLGSDFFKIDPENLISFVVMMKHKEFVQKFKIKKGRLINNNGE